jgi:hypothetical protein
VDQYFADGGNRNRWRKALKRDIGLATLLGLLLLALDGQVLAVVALPA